MGDITGVICATDAQGPVVGAEVWVLTDMAMHSDQTDADGVFLLEGLPAGEHTVYAAKGSFSTSFDVVIEEDELLELAVEECLEADIDIAVFKGQFDSIEDVLEGMAIDFDLYPELSSTESMSLLVDSTALGEYEILFFNCDMALGWTGHQNEITENLAEYVANGGSLYVSDWSFFVLETTFPDAIDFLGNDYDIWDPLAGPSGEITAVVMDENLQAALGSSEATVMFDMGEWAVPQTLGDGVALVEAQVTAVDMWGIETSLVSPLVVRLDHGEGTVYYTTFHNEPQLSGDMLVILEQIVENL
jgi:hypothetical protein